MGTKAGNISFSIVCTQLAKQEHKARRDYKKRVESFRNQEQWEKDRIARLEKYRKENGGILPTVSPSREASGISGLPAIGWDKATQLAETPNRKEKPLRPTVYKYNFGGNR